MFAIARDASLVRGTCCCERPSSCSTHRHHHANRPQRYLSLTVPTWGGLQPRVARSPLAAFVAGRPGLQAANLVGERSRTPRPRTGQPQRSSATLLEWRRNGGETVAGGIAHEGAEMRANVCGQQRRRAAAVRIAVESGRCLSDFAWLPTKRLSAAALTAATAVAITTLSICPTLCQADEGKSKADEGESEPLRKRPTAGSLSSTGRPSQAGNRRRSAAREKSRWKKVRFA